MPRFVILDHDHPFRHWDFLLEAGAVLRAWRLSAEPARGVVIDAEPLPDHRLLYLEYEGPVSGGRGRVLRWDAGTFAWEADRDGAIDMRLAGARVAGVVNLHRSADGRWTWEWR
jgi:DNA polymerase Ligase (LigD)